ncbi:MAG TPA: oligosaccharide flippase family protein [Solirubrobacteraceae bacterium]|nr:oligosaccharide flippase family protein [Solirubrobacteraceae bacterium]
MAIDPDGAGRVESLGADEVRGRAAAGAGLLGMRGAAVYALGIVANLALAHLLTPRDFGVVALGSVLLVVGGQVAAGGVGAALIRRPEPPRRVELEAIVGLQLALATALAGVAAAAAAAIGRDGLVIAVMLASLPIVGFRAPGTIVLERDLLYRPIAVVDLVEAIAYYAWALVAVALGAGVWGLASAVVARALIGVLLMARIGPCGLVRPRWSWRHVRGLVRFGVKLQAGGVVVIVRDQGLNVGVASVAGVATLGVWSLAYRILQVPTLIVTTAVRIMFPLMSRTLAAREEPGPIIERTAGRMAVALGVVLVGLVACAPAALPALLGDEWDDLPATLLWSCLALLVSAPVMVATLGYLYASDHAGTMVAAVSTQAVVWLAVTLPLLPSLGATAVGVGAVPSALALAAIAGRKAARLSGAAILRSLALPTAVGIAAGAVGWAVSAAGGETLLRAAGGLVAGELVLLAGLAIASRALLADTWALAARALRESLPRPAR